MTQTPDKYQKAKPRPKLKPGRHVAMSAEEKAKYEALVNAADPKYAMLVPQDRRRV